MAVTQSNNQVEISEVIVRLLEIARTVVPGAANWCVAGGAVRDQYFDREPHDYDLFIMGLDALSGQINHGFQANGLTLSEHWTREYEMNHVMEYIIPGGKLVHIIATPLTDIEALLDTFDWNICHHAISRDGTAINGGFPETRILRLQPGSLIKPLAALKRGFRFAERYGMAIAPEDLRTLIEGSMIQLDEEDQGLTWDPVMREPTLAQVFEIGAETDDIRNPVPTWTTNTWDNPHLELDTVTEPPLEALTMVTLANTLRDAARNLGMIPPANTGGTNA